MNGVESRYDAHLCALRSAGTVIWHDFEAIKFRLADNTFYTPDFAVLNSGLQLEFHDVKGAKHLVEEDARVKIKVAAELFPVRFFLVYPRLKREGGGFAVEEIGR